MDKLTTIISELEALKVDAEKFFTKGNSAAGTRYRKGLQSVKKKLTEARAEVSEVKKASKAA